MRIHDICELGTSYGDEDSEDGQKNERNKRNEDAQLLVCSKLGVHIIDLKIKFD